MTRTVNDQDSPMKIILFGLRRSGTTLAFNIFRRCEGLRCYYEPMHPNLVVSQGLSRMETDRKGAFSEYRLIQDELQKHHEGFGAPKYDVAEELLQDNLTPRHLSYLDFLFGSADNVLLQPVRLNYQLHQLRAHYPDAHFVWVLRRPDGFINSVLAYRRSLLEYRDAGIPGSNAIDSCKKNLIFRMMRGWHAFDNPWAQIAAANLVVASRPYFRDLASSPTWLKLAALWYDHYLFVTDFIRANPECSRVFIYEKACGSADYIRTSMASIGLRHSENAFDGLIDSDVIRKHDRSRIDIAGGELMIQERIEAMGLDLDLSYRQSMD